MENLLLFELGILLRVVFCRLRACTWHKKVQIRYFFSLVVLLVLLSLFNEFVIFWDISTTHEYKMEDDGDMGGMMMQMTYYWGANVTVLWDFWNTNGNTFYYMVTLIALFLLAIIGELLSVIAAKMRVKAQKMISAGRKDKQDASPVVKMIGSPQENMAYLVGSLFYLVKLVLGYQLMLAVMTFNYGVSIAVFTGAFVGNFVFVRFYDSPDSIEGYNQMDEIACHM